MSKLRKNVRSVLTLNRIGFFLLFLILPISLKASNCRVIFDTFNTSSINYLDIEEAIQSHMKSHSYYPVLTKSDIEFEITHILEESGATYIVGLLSQDKNCLITLFSIEKGWFWSTTNMLYMSTDALHSPLLFKDICSAAQAALPHSLSSYGVLIQKLESPQSPNGGRVQTWTFYNLGEWIELIVLTIPTPDGGTDFVIMRPEQ